MNPSRSAKTKARRCNLCREPFLARSPFERFCARCRRSHELLRYHGWLPEPPVMPPGRLSA